MEKTPSFLENLSELLKYLAVIPEASNGRIPPLAELSQELGISTATLREQLEVARMMGIVEVRPKTGIRLQEYSFRPAVTTSVAYAVSQESTNFAAFSDVRKHLEAAYFIEAAQLLSLNDIQALSQIVNHAQDKMQSSFMQIPNHEHREFHLLIFKNLRNVFVTGMLEAYWDLYRAAGLEIYPDVNYLQRIWQYHSLIVDLIRQKDFAKGLNVLLEHMDLIKQRERPTPRQSFE